jgi:hypothetical protein
MFIDILELAELVSTERDFQEELDEMTLPEMELIEGEALLADHVEEFESGH